MNWGGLGINIARCNTKDSKWFGIDKRNPWKGENVETPCTQNSAKYNRKDRVAKIFIFPSNLSFRLHKFPTCSGRYGYKNHTFKTCNIISLQITNDLKSRKHPGYNISYSNRSRELIINPLYLGEVRVVILTLLHPTF